MARVGIIGLGISAAHLALLLQQYQLDTVIYLERPLEQLASSRLPNVVVRYGRTRDRENALSVDYWKGPEEDISSVCYTIYGDKTLSFCGSATRPLSAVDFRNYLSALFRTYRDRGGELRICTFDESTIGRVAEEHDLVVLAAGRSSLTNLFPRDDERSSISAPLRVFCAGIYEGLRRPRPLSLNIAVIPGVGEVFHTPFTTNRGHAAALFIEGVPNGPLDMSKLRHESVSIEPIVLGMLEEHAPVVLASVRRERFRLAGDVEFVQGAITPVVRKGWASLGGGRYAMALGDAWVLNDPVTGQGANAASDCAAILADCILSSERFGEAFCQNAENRMWQRMRPVVEWTNAVLRGGQFPHLNEIIDAATTEKVVANAFVDNLDDPEAMWACIESPEAARAFLKRARGHRAGGQAETSAQE